MNGKDFDAWNEVKKKTQKVEFTDYVHAREVWWCALGINIGSEQDGQHESHERPVLVIRKFNKDMILVVPATTRLRQTPYHIRFERDDVKYCAIISQLRLISTKRLKRKIFQMDSAAYLEIVHAIQEMIGNEKIL